MARRSFRRIAPFAPSARQLGAVVTAKRAVAPHVVAIVQARMGSTRLPGKVLKPIAGKPLLWHVLHRLKSCSTLNYTVVATSDNPRDDAIEAFCREEKIEIVRGPADNVLARFQQAAQAATGDIIVRVSADSPFVDAHFSDQLVTALIAQ